MNAELSQSLPRRLFGKLVHLVFRFTRPMTLGVRGIVLDQESRIFLVRHSYVPGWHLPGGGVETGETLEEAMKKELSEEGNIIVTGPLVLQGIYFNRHVSRRDHVAVYLIRDFEQSGPRLADREIVETGFFPRDGLPATTTKGTLRRLAEVLDGVEKTQDW